MKRRGRKNFSDCDTGHNPAPRGGVTIKEREILGETHQGRKSNVSRQGIFTNGPNDIEIKSGAPGPILIVDDDRDDQFFLGRTMKTLFGEISIRTFSEGPLMLEYLAQTLEDGGGPLARPRPRLILLDLHLPEMDGLLLLRKIREELGIMDIPIVIVSNTVDSRAIEMAYELGANAFLTKRFTRQDFIQAIHRDERLACLN
jgi:CheY-like chemotaxis protein